MAFMQVASSADSREFTPLAKYDARAGRLFLVDRSQGTDGTWSTNQRDITMEQPQFAIDFPSLEVGWSFFAPGAPPVWAVAPYGQPLPAKPASPGSDDKGKALQFKQAFRVRLVGSAIGGVRELGGNSAALIEGMNSVHTRYEASPEKAQGKIPLVKMTTTLAVKSGQSTNYQPVFDIVGYVDRPATLGAAPQANGHAPTPSASNGAAQHVPPPVTAPAPAPVAAAPASDVPF